MGRISGSIICIPLHSLTKSSNFALFRAIKITFAPISLIHELKLGFKTRGDLLYLSGSVSLKQLFQFLRTPLLQWQFSLQMFAHALKLKSLLALLFLREDPSTFIKWYHLITFFLSFFKFLFKFLISWIYRHLNYWNKFKSSETKRILISNNILVYRYSKVDKNIPNEWKY